MTGVGLKMRDAPIESSQCERWLLGALIAELSEGLRRCAQNDGGNGMQKTVVDTVGTGRWRISCPLD